MTSPTSIALLGFILWTLFLLVLMGVFRIQLVMQRKVRPNAFTPDNANLSPFMQRLARAHANCIENLPIVGALLLFALATDRTSITDSLAYLFLASRAVQSLVHLTSTSTRAVTLRFSAFAVQVAISFYWAFKLLAAA